MFRRLRAVVARVIDGLVLAADRKAFFRQSLVSALILIMLPLFLHVIGGPVSLSNLLSPKFWLSYLGVLLSIFLFSFTVSGVLMGLGLAYLHFCNWFDQALTRAKARSRQRQLANSGVTSWPEDDPLHDRELDG